LAIDHDCSGPIWVSMGVATLSSRANPAWAAGSGHLQL